MIPPRLASEPGEGAFCRCAPVRSGLMPTYAQCPDCGLKFETRSIVAINSSVTVSGGARERCPRCGSKRARTMEGTFSFDADQRVTVLRGPQWSRDLVREMQERMREIGRIAQTGKLTDDEARQRIEEILREVSESNPVVADEYRKATRGRPRASWRDAALAVLGALEILEHLNTVGDFADKVADLLRHFGWVS